MNAVIERESIVDGAKFLCSPYPYFGGKRTVTTAVWSRFGDVKNYVEPFFGSGAMLLGRPQPFRGVETVNDIDGFIVNFWRAVKAEPDAVAELCDSPVNECDLESRHKWLCSQPGKTEFLHRVKDDPDFYDVKRAAWWCWGLCAWIGSGWCEGEWHGRGKEKSKGRGVHGGEVGKMPNLGSSQGVNRQIPRLGSLGKLQATSRNEFLRTWFATLSARLRYVRVCCGDWSRLTSRTALDIQGLTAVFLDPPYLFSVGRESVYRMESATVADDVREWAIQNGDNPLLRIALCGYEGEHVMPDSWECVPWKANGGMANQRSKKDTQGKENKHRERMWFSPHCLKPDEVGLFE